MASTGNGATISFGDPPTPTPGVDVIGRIVRMGEWPESVADIPDNDLSIPVGGHMQYCPGDLVDHDEVPLDVVFDGDISPLLGDEQLITITYPVPEGKSNGATRVGLGWIKRRGNGPMATGERPEASFAIRFKGGAAGIGHTAST